MTESDIKALIDLIDKAVNSDGSWMTKKAAILEEASEDEITYIREFAGWFE